MTADRQRAERDAYLAKMEAERGYILDFHRILAEEDFAFLKRYDSLLQAAYLDRSNDTDSKTKELILIAVLVAVRSPAGHIETHMRVAKRLGATKGEILAILKICLLPAGLPAFMQGFDVWRDVFEV